MRRSNLGNLVSWQLLLGLLFLTAACSAHRVGGMRGSERTTRAPRDTTPSPTVVGGQEQPVDSGDYNGPELWIHGIGGAPEKGGALSAQGIRFIFNLRKSPSEASLRKMLEKYADNNLGLVLTLRWSDAGVSQEGQVKYDTPPTAQEAREANRLLLNVLNSPEAKRLSELWVQFYNEFAGGPGTFKYDKIDAYFQYATDTADLIRREAPHVKICGPSLTSPEVIDKDSVTSVIGKRRKEGIERAIQWSVKHADAVDLHLHIGSVDEAKRMLSTVRTALDEQPGGDKIAILVLEWSPAKYRNQKDLKGAEEIIIGSYRVMAQYHVLIAAYANYYVPKYTKSVYQWATLTDENGNPREPFWSLFQKLAKGHLSAIKDQP